MKIVSRAEGRSAVAAAAYRSCSRLKDDRLDRTHDYGNKPDLVHSAILLPGDAPDRFADRAALWNEVEATERRKDAQLAREVEFALPRELSDAANIALARSFVQEMFVDRGMIADLNIHKPAGADGQPQPHAHVLLTMRRVDASGFGPKERTWNSRSFVEHTRELLAVRINQALAREGIEARVDHRSHAERGIDLAPQSKIGPAAAKLAAEGKPSGRVTESRAIAAFNGERLLATPELGLDYLTEHQSTFTKADMARFVARNTDGAEQFTAVMAKLEAHADLVRVGTDQRGRERFSTRRMIATEARMAEHAKALAAVPEVPSLSARRTAPEVEQLGAEQREAMQHVTRAGGLKLVEGYAGTGKSRMLGAARAQWEQAGLRVRGAALSGIAAENLEHGSGIESRTLASLEWAWARGRDRLESRDVLVIDEAGMIGSRQMERVLRAAREAKAKVVLVGDPAQLQAIEAGGAFRYLAQEHGAAQITHVRRQISSWMQRATVEMSTGKMAQALDRYDAAGMVHFSETRAEAMTKLVAQWNHDRNANPRRSQIMLAWRRSEVRQLNELARAHLRARGELGEDVEVRTSLGKRTMAAGDRVMFLKNERGLGGVGVKNGTLGVLRGLEGSTLTVQLDADGKKGAGAVIRFDTRDYAGIDHGYAMTVHKSQGSTASRSYVLASKGFDRHMTLVAASRHRGRMDLHLAREDFKDRTEAGRWLGRPRPKDVTQDYVRDPARERLARVTANVAARMRGPARSEAQTQAHTVERKEKLMAGLQVERSDIERQPTAARGSEGSATDRAETQQPREQDAPSAGNKRFADLARAVALKMRGRGKERDEGRGL